MNIPVVSIVVINYNGEKWIPDTLKSIEDQKYPNLEFVLVDDCSTDGSLALFEKFAARHARTHVLKTECNSGIGAARNLGMLNSSGEFIAFLDSDDMFLPDTIKLNVEDFERISRTDPNLGMLMTDAWIVNEQGKRFGRYMPRKWWGREQVKRSPNWTLPSTWFVKRKAAPLFCPEYRFGEAVFFVERLRKTNTVAFIGRPGVLYRNRLHSATNDKAAEELRTIAATELTIAQNRFDDPVMPSDVPAPSWRATAAWKHGRTAKSAFINGRPFLALKHAAVAAVADLPRFVKKGKRVLLETRRRASCDCGDA